MPERRRHRLTGAKSYSSAGDTRGTEQTHEGVGEHDADGQAGKAQVNDFHEQLPDHAA